MKGTDFIIAFSLAFLVFPFQAIGQELGVFNEKDKMILKIRQGRNLDFRIDYRLLYPEVSDSVLEARVVGVVDSISGTDIYLIENQIITKYSRKGIFETEEDYEYTSLKVSISDIKEIAFTPTAASIGNALLTIGIAAILASPLMGLTPDGYSTDRVLTAAATGAGLALAGATLTLSFGQKPLKMRDFDGPPYFRKNQRGSISDIKP